MKISDAIMALLLIMTATVFFVLYRVHEFYKPAVTIIEINNTPANYLEDNPNLKLLSVENSNKKFKYVFFSVSEGSSLDGKKYKKAHPHDIMLKHYMGDGSEDLLVLSDDPPDPKFFKVIK